MMAYREAPPERVIFCICIFLYERVGISLVELCTRVGKSVIWVLRKGPKGLRVMQKFETKYVKGVSFVNRRYRKAVLFFREKWYIKR